MSHVLVDLEYGNKKVDIKKAKKMVSELEKLSNALGRRLREEVYDEVVAYAKKNNKNYKGDVSRFQKD
jgi:hypothetical protein